ncbi:DUF1289 domain-containing protein [Colwellia sp. 12G3]|uniref:DUF1289 domain-containing protein n=1 Tax=Colwellia sp. 12G3 TaxID=2058299 RepID=UPI000C349CA1|nr:DUF1289 domain-containing protein [Colwellia sp. 12G3]PKI12786.1 DUF1289 domain-containing protein [Colwellia sp. 12G3]
MQLEFFDVPSPCIGICQLDEKGHCLGCMRSRDERQDWKNFNNDEKQKVIKRCLQRQKRKKNKSNPKQEQIVSTSERETDMQPSLLDPPSKTEIADDTDIDFSDFEL